MCASYSKRSVQNCKITRYFTKRCLNEFMKRCASYIKHTVRNCKKRVLLLNVHCLRIIQIELLIRSALYKIVNERVLYQNSTQ